MENRRRFRRILMPILCGSALIVANISNAVDTPKGKEEVPQFTHKLSSDMAISVDAGQFAGAKKKLQAILRHLLDLGEDKQKLQLIVDYIPMISQKIEDVLEYVGFLEKEIETPAGTMKVTCKIHASHPDGNEDNLRFQCTDFKITAVPTIAAAGGGFDWMACLKTTHTVAMPIVAIGVHVLDAYLQKNYGPGAKAMTLQGVDEDNVTSAGHSYNLMPISRTIRIAEEGPSVPAPIANLFEIPFTIAGKQGRCYGQKPDKKFTVGITFGEVNIEPISIELPSVSDINIGPRSTADVTENSEDIGKKSKKKRSSRTGRTETVTVVDGTPSREVEAPQIETGERKETAVAFVDPTSDTGESTSDKGKEEF